MRPISGVCPVLATPFDDDGEPDARGLARIAEFAICCGADAVVYPGVASEVEQLTASERNRLLDVLAAAVHGRVPLIVGATDAQLPATIGLTQGCFAGRRGVRAVHIPNIQTCVILHGQVRRAAVV